MTIIQAELKDTVERLTKKKINLQLPKRRDMVKDMTKTTIMGPCALTFDTQLNTENSNDKRFSSKLFDFITKHNLPEVLEVVEFSLESRDIPWKKELFKVKKGQQVTFLLDGKWWFFKEHNMWVEPGTIFHAKIGNENYYNTGSNTGTMTATKSGSLTIGRSLGEFKNHKGELNCTEEEYKKRQGFIDGVAILWKDTSLEGLYKLSSEEESSGIIYKEIQRQIYNPLLPKSWKNTFLFNSQDIFSKTNTREITCHSHKNVGILQKNVDIEMVKELKFNWTWLMEYLPTEVSEKNANIADYLAIAIKFDDGQYLTYMWSNIQKEKQTFKTPLDGWKNININIVQCSGKRNLKKWLSESRNVQEDYKKFINSTAKKVIEVSLIANTLFTRGIGKCKYANIEFNKKGEKTIIL